MRVTTSSQPGDSRATPAVTGFRMIAGGRLLASSPPIEENHLLRCTRRAAPALAAALTLGFGVQSAVAQTPAPTTPPAIEVPTTSTTPILPVGNDIPSAGTNQCFVRLFKPKDVPTALVSEGSLAVQYRLRCAAEITGFVVSFNREVDGAETELFTTRLTDNGIIADEAFNCSGEFPGWGVSCTGNYRGGYNTVRGIASISLTDEEVANKTPFCKLGISATATTFTSVLARDPYTNKVLSNKDGTSQIRHFASGPFKVTTPACHRGASADAEASKKKPSKKASKKTRRS